MALSDNKSGFYEVLDSDWFFLNDLLVMYNWCSVTWVPNFNHLNKSNDVILLLQGHHFWRVSLTFGTLQ